MRVPNLIKLFQRVMLSRPMYLLAKQSHQFAGVKYYFPVCHKRTHTDTASQPAPTNWCKVSRATASDGSSFSMNCGQWEETNMINDWDLELILNNESEMQFSAFNRVWPGLLAWSLTLNNAKQLHLSLRIISRILNLKWFGENSLHCWPYPGTEEFNDPVDKCICLVKQIWLLWIFKRILVVEGRARK